MNPSSTGTVPVVVVGMIVVLRAGSATPYWTTVLQYCTEASQTDPY
jgi:hypothetical protein